MAFELDLQGKTALVTGSGQGVGRATAMNLAKAGATVAVNDVVAERAQSVVDEISALGGKAVAAPFDVTDYGLVTDSFNALGGVDILVNNAGNAGTEGFAGMLPFHQTEPDQWDRFFKINLFGVMYCTRAALPAMIERQGGRIITIVSDAGRYGDMGLAAYAGAKAGAAGFSRSVAREVGRYGITVNCIALGTINTPTSSRDGKMELTPEEAKKRFGGYIVRRAGEPEDVAGMVTYLASPLTSWITGQTYPVNGGYTLSL
jgi:3-oxoacyl-[acyl-carrier protein] reductase